MHGCGSLDHVRLKAKQIKQIKFRFWRHIHQPCVPRDRRW